MIKIDVPYIDQSEKYPTGCESVTTVMLLHYLGYDISVDDFIKNYLRMRDFETRDGVLYGPDPWEYFVGSPYDPDSFGCYAPVICEALGKIVGDTYEVCDETGKDLDELVETYLKQDMPVILWNSINMREPIIGPEWKLLDTGKNFTWISNEHCMLLVGEDEDSYIFNDPYENRGVIACPKGIIRDRYEVYHRQAVGLKKQ
ncbi:MAG: C39 family peptidase [Oliverpabstia sp.]